MSHVLFWPTITYFYPVGNTSAVCLTENLPPESRADVLVLGCGDPRHILYTIDANEGNPLTALRTLDITCCDLDVAILARNTLLFTFLADDGVLNKLDDLWNLFYHMFVDKHSLSILFEQCRKLVALAETMESWRAGPYGYFLIACDAPTLRELRRIWTAYLDTATFSSEQLKQFEQRFIDGMKTMSRRTGFGGVTTAARSAGPLALHACEAVACQFKSYWSSGLTSDSARGQKRRLTVNPTFAFSVNGDKFAVQYGTDPLCGFHLAEAFASGTFTRPESHIPPHDLVRVARNQFARWCTSAAKRLKDNNPSSPTFVLRMFAGDALMFCQALKYCEVTRSPITPYNIAAWRLSTITFDDHSYGRNALSPAPLSFNVIDTSNLLDYVGLVNLLVVSAPLLRKTPAATLYTEALLRMGDTPSQAILEHVCGDLPTMALLLGIFPSTMISQFTTRSNAHEVLMMGENAKQYHERLAWKAIGFGEPRARHGPDDVPSPLQRLRFSPEDLAQVLFRVYLHMFSSEDIRSRLQLLSLPPQRVLQELRRVGILHYNRRSFALFVHFVKTRVQTDWWLAMDLFEDLVLANETLMTGAHSYHELCGQLHLLGVYTTPWMNVAALRLPSTSDDDDDDLGLFPFRDWTRTHIPHVVTLVFVIPREAITRLEPDFMEDGTPALHCDMHDGPRQLWFAVTSATFGSLRVSGTGEHRTGVVIEADGGGDGDAVTAGTGMSTIQPPWRTKAPLIVTFSVPSVSVMDFAQSPGATVGLALCPTMMVTAKFAGRLGFDLTVFRTGLADAERVLVLARPPVVGSSTSTSTSTGRSAVAGTGGAVMAGHWQEDMKVDLYSERATNSRDVSCTTADVHVQINETASTIQSLAVRIDVTDPNARATLANPQTVPVVSSVSGPTRSLDACVNIGKHRFVVRFPLPIDMSRVRLRVARQSSYIEVVAPLAPFEVRPERDFSNRFAPLSVDPKDDGSPTLGSIHRVNLDRCPAFKLSKHPPKLNWCHIHLYPMFSALERNRVFRTQVEPPVRFGCVNGYAGRAPDTLTDIKHTLHLLLRRAAGADPDSDQGPDRVFALFDTSRGVTYLYIIVARVCLDVGSHTVVADAFVAPDTPTVRSAMTHALYGGGSTSRNDDDHGQRTRTPDISEVRYITTDADEAAAWFHLLPRLTERCRTWAHKTTCVYRSTARQHRQQQQKPSERPWAKQSPLCACGAGVGTEILPRRFAKVAPNLTRAAFSPLFPVPYLEEVDAPFTGVGTPEEDVTKVDVGKTNFGAGAGYGCRWCGKDSALMTCSRCKSAQYCSKACQRADWKVHKEDCR